MNKSDPRPPVWVGHILLETDRLNESEAFMKKIGMRPIAKQEGTAVLELRGGTHLVLRQSDDVSSGAAPFDLMVEDLNATHQALSAMGLNPSGIRTGRLHSSFKVREPSGQTITFTSSHVSDLPV
jgi:hypothetical protein